MSELFTHSIELCLETAIGSSGLTEADLNLEVSRTADILARLRDARDSASMPLLTMPSNIDDLDEIIAAAEKIRASSSDVIICGTGGSSLGGQALAQLAGWHIPAGAETRALRGRPYLHFLDNIDASSFDSLVCKLDLTTTHVIVISKSGTTAETLSQAILLLTEFQRHGLGEKIGEHFCVITKPDAIEDNGLRRLAAKFSMSVIDHPAALGGRFSVLSCVGLLPAAIAGLDITAIRRGAANTLDAALDATTPHESAPALGAATAVALSRDFGISCSVLFAYGDRLERFTRWYVQLWAESLGKDGLGTTPLAALGPVDQHSQFQLFLDGPADKFYTILATNARGKGQIIDPDLALEAGVKNLAGHALGDLVESMQRATIETLARKGRPVRELFVDSLNEEAMGGLMMHFMLETIIAAELLGVNPFDQPAVEESKALARDMLTDL